MRDRYDVAIIGAGPAGSATAISLARCGYSVAIIDKQTFPRDKLCGDFINPINWSVLAELGVDTGLRTQPHAMVRGFKLTTHRGTAVEVDFPKTNSIATLGVGMRRYWLDQLLLNQARADGAATILGAKVARAERQSDGWIIEIDGGATRHYLFARVLVGADGRNSWVAERFGLAPKPLTGSALGFQYRLTAARHHERVEIHLFPGG